MYCVILKMTSKISVSLLDPFALCISLASVIKLMDILHRKQELTEVMLI